MTIIFRDNFNGTLAQSISTRAPEVGSWTTTGGDFKCDGVGNVTSDVTGAGNESAAFNIPAGTAIIKIEMGFQFAPGAGYPFYELSWRLQFFGGGGFNAARLRASSPTGSQVLLKMEDSNSSDLVQVGLGSSAGYHDAMHVYRITHWASNFTTVVVDEVSALSYPYNEIPHSGGVFTAPSARMQVFAGTNAPANLMAYLVVEALPAGGTDGPIGEGGIVVPPFWGHYVNTKEATS